jgi:putative hemolysin
VNPFEPIASLWGSVEAFFAFDASRLTEPDMILRIGLQVALLFGSAFFSGSETALFSLSRLDLHHLRRTGHAKSDVLHSLLDQPRRLIISILCGNELVNVAAAANMTGILVVLYGDERAGWINILLMVPLLLMLGEVTPKTIAVSHPVGASTRVVAGPMDLWVKLVAPLRWLMRGVAEHITTMVVGQQREAEHLLQMDEFRSLVEEVTEEGVLSATDRALVHNLLDAATTEVVEIMTPRTQTRFLDAEMSVEEMVQHAMQYRMNRLPVYQGQRDNVVGFVHSEDIMRLVMDGVDLAGSVPGDITHPPVMVPLTKHVDEMLDFFQMHDARAAVVLNEFGGVEGLVTLDDVLAFIFGAVADQMPGQELYEERDKDDYIVPGDMKLTAFNMLTNFGIEDPRMTTIGGVALRHLDRLPREGDTVVVDGIRLTVLAMEGHRVARVRATRGAAVKQAEASEHREAVPAPGEPLREPAFLDTDQAEPPLVRTDEGSDTEFGEPPAHEADPGRSRGG